MELTRPHSEISLSELEVFDSLKYISVVFDVGARMEMDSSTVPCVLDYLELKPKAKYHLFEPNPLFATQLKDALGYRPNVVLNEFGLGDRETILHYSNELQTLSGSDAWEGKDGPEYRTTTLDAYCKENNIKRISFLKMDTEGFERRILRGARQMLPNIRYIQYEEWNNDEKIQNYLKRWFTFKNIGFRNTLCIRKS